jgi:hypothetical protein
MTNPGTPQEKNGDCEERRNFSFESFSSQTMIIGRYSYDYPHDFKWAFQYPGETSFSYCAA